MIIIMMIIQSWKWYNDSADQKRIWRWLLERKSWIFLGCCNMSHVCVDFWRIAWRETDPENEMKKEKWEERNKNNHYIMMMVMAAHFILHESSGKKIVLFLLFWWWSTLSLIVSYLFLSSPPHHTNCGFMGRSGSMQPHKYSSLWDRDSEHSWLSPATTNFTTTVTGEFS